MNLPNYNVNAFLSMSLSKWIMMIDISNVHWSPNFTKITFQTNHLEVVLSYPVQYTHEVTLPDDDKLHFVEEPVEIMDREVKQLRRSRVPIVKFRWNSTRGPEFTWERKDQFRKKYPHLFTKIAPSSSAV
ncbi:hypothetical protein Tco_0578228 [Tanacetum coccineum]